MARRRLFALVLCSALALAACSKDPVLADLAAMDQVGQTAFKDNSKINALMQQASASKSQEEQSRLLGEVGQEMMRKAKAMEAFTAQTPEVGKIHSDLTTAMKDAAQGAIDSQTAFDRKARLANLSDAFALLDGAEIDVGQRHVLIDDVFTTGATLNSCAHALRRAGCMHVDVATFGHG